jgi:hypothetical protein
MSCAFCVEVVILAAPATVQFVRCGNFQNLDTRCLHVAQQPRTVAAGAFDSDALEIPEGVHPGQHQAIPVSGCREALGTENTVAMINDSRDMQVLVCIDATDDVSFCLVFSHPIILSCGR